jgi:hypothetical protein
VEIFVVHHPVVEGKGRRELLPAAGEIFSDQTQEWLMRSAEQ